MALWTLSRSVLESPATGMPGGSLNDKIATPSLVKTVQGRVNVIDKFNWTTSPRAAARSDAPSILLNEKRILTNALIAQLKYSLGAAATGLGGVGGQLQAAAAGGTGTVSNIANLVGRDLASLGAVTQGVSNVMDYLIGSDNNSSVATSPYLKPYKHLYITEPTGWAYLMPYFENTQDSIQNQFGTSGATNVTGYISQGIADAATGVAEFMTGLSNFTSITYVERTKFFNYSDDGDDIQITFPLINTGSSTYDDVVNNWQLVYLLLLQNRPGKTSINTVEPPVIYEVTIPGVKYYPYAFVSSISVEFQGARREMMMSIPYAEGQTSQDQTVDGGREVTTLLSPFSFSAIIPDAYLIRMTLHGLNAQTRNFMFHTLYQNVVQADAV